mmetsp:Transcript_31132/g.54713  ORF Transcript_31132/g.54713 Transcript_31132/m.54713 type:complete len:227 (-) Transcript_31132:714-1394(-)
MQVLRPQLSSNRQRQAAYENSHRRTPVSMCKLQSKFHASRASSSSLTHTSRLQAIRLHTLLRPLPPQSFRHFSHVQTQGLGSVQLHSVWQAVLSKVKPQSPLAQLALRFQALQMPVLRKKLPDRPRPEGACLHTPVQQPAVPQLRRGAGEQKVARQTRTRKACRRIGKAVQMCDLRQILRNPTLSRTPHGNSQGIQAVQLYRMRADFSLQDASTKTPAVHSRQSWG